MLPLHGQATAAVEDFTGQNIPFISLTRGNVFVKQSDKSFVEFLL